MAEKNDVDYMVNLPNVEKVLVEMDLPKSDEILKRYAEKFKKDTEK